MSICIAHYTSASACGSSTSDWWGSYLL